MLSYADRYRRAFDDTLLARLSLIDSDDEQEAAGLVAAAVKDAQAAGEQALVTAVVVDARNRARAAEQQERQDQRRREQAEHEEREGMAELRSLVGAKLADEVEPWRAYRLIQVGEGAAAVVMALDDSDPARTRARATGFNSDGTPIIKYGSAHPVIEALEHRAHFLEADGSLAPKGVRMAKVLRERFDGQLDAVDPTPGEALALVEQAATA
jgi:hypothetical protein